MVDLVITAANVAAQAGSSTQTKNAAVAIVAGQSVYVDGSGTLLLCEKDQTAVEAQAAGIALNDAAIGQPCTYVVAGSVDLGAVIAAGTTYIVGAGPGGIAPSADLASTEFGTILGIGISANVIQIGLNPAGVAAP